MYHTALSIIAVEKELCMHKQRFEKLLIGSVLLVPQIAAASDMGNGPAALAVWSLGTVIALLISFISSCTRDELGAMQEFKLKKFIVVLAVQLPVIFIIGFVAIFI